MISPARSRVIKANPGKFNFGSAGAGTTQQFAGELMKQIAGLDMRHVPYRSTPAVLAGMLSGDVEMVFELIQTIQGQVNSGTLKAIAVTSPQRNPILPNVPTFAESGMPGYDVTSWYGVALPAGTPQAIVQKMNKAMVELLARDSVRDQILEARRAEPQLDARAAQDAYRGRDREVEDGAREGRHRAAAVARMRNLNENWAR